MLSGSTAGSSRTFPSDEECRRFASTENGASPRLSFAMGIWCASANSISLVRLVRSHSRHGAMILMSGIGAEFLRDLDLLLGDERPRDGGAQQIDAFIERVGAKHREDVIADEFLAH